MRQVARLDRDHLYREVEGNNVKLSSIKDDRIRWQSRHLRIKLNHPPNISSAGRLSILAEWLLYTRPNSTGRVGAVESGLRRAPCGFVWARFVECVEDSVLDGIDPLSRKHGPEIYLVSLILLTKFIRFFGEILYVKTFSGPFSPNHRRGKRMLRKMKRKLMRAKSPPKQRLFRSTVRVQQP